MDNIIVKVNGKKYDTYFDEYGVQRFVPNPIVRAMIDSQNDLYNKIGYHAFKGLELYGLNELGIDYQVGTNGITLENMIDFYTQIGYSVSGFCDISFFEKVKVKNPLWEKK